MNGVQRFILKALRKAYPKENGNCPTCGKETAEAGPWWNDRRYCDDDCVKVDVDSRLY